MLLSFQIFTRNYNMRRGIINFALQLNFKQTLVWEILLRKSNTCFLWRFEYRRSRRMNKVIKWIALIEDVNDVYVFYTNYTHFKHLFAIFICELSKYFFHFSPCIYIDLNDVLFFRFNVMDELSVDTPCDVPEEVLLLFLITFDSI